jgi:signal transduction histidine kinase/AraC-like DNA-binding protein
MMAYSSYEVYRDEGLPKPKIIGVDGLACNGCGMQFVSEKLINATMLYPTGGEEAIRIALKILKKEEFKKENRLQTTVIDSTNVRLMQLQTSKITSQQQSIERQQLMLSEQERIYKSQRSLLYILGLLLLIAIILGGFVFYSLNENKKMNKKLHVQNIEISEQKDKLVEMSEKARAANEAKVNFFTNISHEFRTPLTLILAPLEEITAGKHHHNHDRNLNLIHRNVIRLLRLVNQLMDFRQVEADRMRLRVSENDLISFVSGIIQTYQSMAHKRNIDLRLITSEWTLPAWFDANMLDKVIFNLLSNAFKFTKDNGFIHVYINRAGNSNVILKVEDNGIGMAENVVKNAFELYYQGEYETRKGSGLGLALSKELINLHKGSISVRSEQWKGTTFEIHLPLGHSHFDTRDFADPATSSLVLYADEKVYETYLDTDHVPVNEIDAVNRSFEHCILVIEDNEELRRFLKEKLKSRYEMLEADNGQSALQQAFDTVPDLIICDVVIPGKDGLALVKIFKTDLRTSHIPVILLTGKTSIEQQIEGMKNMADVYIPKPFNLQFLEQTINSLLSNRAMLKEHFTSELPSNLKTQTIGKIDRKFISEFTSLIERNISNENFSVEDICKTLGISRVQLYRKVKALMNINVNEYILNTRLQKAKYLLQHEDFNISEIAYKIGFSSPAYFSTVFKSKFGVTPKAFKEK